MSKNKSNKEAGVALKVDKLKPAKFKLSREDRLSIDVNNYKYYLGGEKLIKKLDAVLNKIEYLKELSDYELNKVRFVVLSNFYSELFYLLGFDLIIYKTEGFDKIFNNYIENIFTTKSKRDYKRVSKDLIEFQNKKLLENYPFLIGKDELGEGFLVALETLLPKKSYHSNRRYTKEMYQYYYHLLSKGYKHIPASEETFNKFFTEDELKKFKDLEKKMESFRRQAQRTKI